MGTAFVKDVLYRASVLMQDRVPQFTQSPEAEMVSWLNDGQVAIAKFLPSSCSRIDAIHLKPGTLQSIQTIAPADIIPSIGSVPTAPITGVTLNKVTRNMGAAGTTPGRVIRISPGDLLDSQSPDWHTAAWNGRVELFVFDPRTPKHFYVYPPVPSSRWWVEASFLAEPERIPVPGPGVSLYGAESASTVTISVDDKHVDDLVNYICARCYLKDNEYAGNAAKAVEYGNLFINSLNAQAVALTGVNPNLSTLPLAATPAAQAS